MKVYTFSWKRTNIINKRSTIYTSCLTWYTIVILILTRVTKQVNLVLWKLTVHRARPREPGHERSPIRTYFWQINYFSPPEFYQEPINRSMIVRYILPSTQSQKCLFLDPDFQRKAVTMTATKAQNMADKLLARSTISWSDVIKSYIVIGQIRHPLFRGKRKSKNRHFCDCADGQT